MVIKFNFSNTVIKYMFYSCLAQGKEAISCGGATLVLVQGRGHRGCHIPWAISAPRRGPGDAHSPAALQSSEVKHGRLLTATSWLCRQNYPYFDTSQKH